MRSQQSRSSFQGTKQSISVPAALPEARKKRLNKSPDSLTKHLSCRNTHAPISLLRATASIFSRPIRFRTSPANVRSQKHLPPLAVPTRTSLTISSPTPSKTIIRIIDSRLEYPYDIGAVQNHMF